MRTTLRYGVAAGILAAVFSTLGPVSAYAGQTSGAPAPASATQQQAPDRHVHCIHHHFHRYCRVYPH
jgi:hypothetical protein